MPPTFTLFKPAGIPASSLEEVVLPVDELEAIRLVDLEGMYQEQAAEEMGVSRQTVGRILESAHKKIAQVLVHGMALRIEGGEVEMNTTRHFECCECKHTWEMPHGTGRPAECPQCKSANIHRAAENRGFARGAGMGQRHGCRRGQCHGRGPVVQSS